VAMVGFFTEGLRTSIERWAETPDASLMVVANKIAELLTLRVSPASRNGQQAKGRKRSVAPAGKMS
jgi:uncharacterized protein YejL (UPF0352 family)